MELLLNSIYTFSARRLVPRPPSELLGKGINHQTANYFFVSFRFLFADNPFEKFVKEVLL